MKKYYIYKITFQNNKSYIGLTFDVEKRIKEHLNESKRNRYPLSKAINKFNKQFQVDIICCAYNYQDACELEKYFIQCYNTNIENNQGYNATLGGDGVFGRKHPEEERQKIKDAIKGKMKANKTSFKKGNKTWCTGLKGKGIVKANKGSFKKGDPRIKLGQAKARELGPWNKGKKLDDSYRDKLSKAHGAKLFRVYKTDTGELVGEYYNQSKCAELLGLSKKSVNQCLKGKRQSHLGYRFEFVENNT